MLSIGRKCSKTELITNSIQFYKQIHRRLIEYDFSKILVLHKITRYEFEKHRYPNLTEHELKTKLEKRGSNYNRLIEHHNTHYRSLEKIVEVLNQHKIQTKVIQRFKYCLDDIQWADCVLTAGGDGTFLNAASKIRDNQKPVIAGSEGHLLLPKQLSINVALAFKKILSGDFKWLMRTRIQVDFEGQNSDVQPIELHDQFLTHLEHRNFEHVEENRTAKLESTENKINEAYPKKHTYNLALNEVFIGESLSARVSYYQMSIDDAPLFKQKSSGIILCTGTGSSSWCYNINKMSLNSIKKILKLINKELPNRVKSIPEDDRFVQKITNKFNDSLLFNPDEQRMTYTIRDPIINRIFQNETNRGFAKKVIVQSRCYDACLVIDGSMSYQFNDGAKAILTVKPENSLRTILINE